MITLPKTSVGLLLAAGSPADRAAYRRLLAEAKEPLYKIVEAGDVRQAATMLVSARPDCVLIDHDLPGGGGLALLHEIVARCGLHASGVVMLLEPADMAATGEALQNGAHDFLLKGGINAVLLQQGMRNAIEKAGIYRELEARRKETARQNVTLETQVATAGCGERARDSFPEKTGRVKRGDVLVSPIPGRNGKQETAPGALHTVIAPPLAAEARSTNEARLPPASAAGKMGVWSWDIPTDKVTWSESLYGIYGLSPGQFGGTVEAFSKLIHPDDLKRVCQAIDDALAGKAVYEVEFRGVRPDGVVVWLFTNATIVREDGRPLTMLGATLDITARKREERHTEFLARLGQQLGLLSEPEEIVRVAQEAIGRHLGVQRCYFFEVDSLGQSAVIQNDWRVEGLESAGGRYVFSEFRTPEFLKCLAQSRFSVTDVLADPLIRNSVESHLRIQSRAFATASYYQEGRWVVSLGVNSGEVRDWREDELKLLQEAVVRVWPSVEKARTDRQLLDSAQQLRLAASSARLGAWSWDAASDVITFSPQAAEIFGVVPALSMTWAQMLELLYEEDRERARKAVETAVATHSEYAIEYRVLRDDRKTIWVAATGRGQYAADGTLFGMVGVMQDVTRRKEAEGATRQLAAIVASSDDAIVSKNLQGTVLSWNTGAERLFGYTTAEMIGTPIMVLLPPEQYDEEPRILERIRRGERIEHYETTRRHKSGRLIDVSLTVSPIKDENGWIIGASKIARDISSRKATERALSRRTHTLEILNHVGGLLVAERDLEKIVQAVTDAAREVTGAQFGAFFYNTVNEQGESYTLYTLSGAPREAFANFPMPRNTLVFGPTFHGEGPIRVADILADPRYGKNAPHHGMPPGHLPVRSYLAVPVKSGTGEVIGGLFFGHPETDVFTQESEDVLKALAAQAAIAIDNARLYRAVDRELTEQKRVREEVRAREQQLRLVTNNAPVFLLQCDREYRYTFANEPYAKRYGLNSETLIGRTVWEVTGQTAFNAAKSHIDAALAGNQVEFEMEIPYDHIGTRWVHVTFVPNRDEKGEVGGFVGVLTDITQRKSAELELERARDEALAASRAKDDFLAALSHELRTPLNPVLLIASDAVEDESLAAETRQSFETIRHQVTLEARLIDDLLDLTRVTRGKLPLDRRMIDAHAVLEEAIGTMKTELESKRLNFRVELKADRHVVFGDSVRLQQVVWNLLKNAVKFTADGGEITVGTSVNERTSRFRLTIQDTGIGLTAGELTKIFEAFSQGEHAAGGGSHRFGGLGLGLAISRSIVEMHGGDIHAESAGRNHGATFIIELPLMSATTPVDQIPGNENTEAVSPHETSGAKRGRLLIIEDHAPTRNTLKSLLSRRNFEVMAASTGGEARELARLRPPDLVISDIGLPDSDGCTLMKEFRAVNPTLPGIALSGYGMDEDLARTRAAGFVAHLTKPVNVSALERAIETILSSKN